MGTWRPTSKDKHIPLIICYDDKSGKLPILTVGQKKWQGPGVELINWFEGSEATELYEKLTKKSDKV